MAQVPQQPDEHIEGKVSAPRDPLPGKPANWCTLDYESVRALAETNYEGDTHYGLEAWTKGIPASNLMNHALEHIFKLLDGDDTEDHIGHAMWNLGKMRWMAKHKPELIDLPRARRAMKLGEPSATAWNEFPAGSPSQHGQRVDTDSFARAQSVGPEQFLSGGLSASASGSSATGAAESGDTSDYRRCNLTLRGLVCVLNFGHLGKCVNCNGFLFDPAPSPRQA